MKYRIKQLIVGIILIIIGIMSPIIFYLLYYYILLSFNCEKDYAMCSCFLSSFMTSIVLLFIGITIVKDAID